MNGKIFPHNSGLHTQAGAVLHAAPQPDFGEVTVSWRKERRGAFFLSVEFRRSPRAAPVITTMAITGSGTLLLRWPGEDNGGAS
jgi:hypothetical protein